MNGKTTCLNGEYQHRKQSSWIQMNCAWSVYIESILRRDRVNSLECNGAVHEIISRYRCTYWNHTGWVGYQCSWNMSERYLSISEQYLNLKVLIPMDYWGNVACFVFTQYTVFEQTKRRVLRTTRVPEQVAGGTPILLSALQAFLLGAFSKTVATVLTYPAIRYLPSRHQILVYASVVVH